MFLLNFLNDDNSFSLMINVFTGITALMISLIIFIMDRGKEDKRIIFKNMLLEYSEVKELMILALTDFILIIIQSFFLSNSVHLLTVRFIFFLILIRIIFELIFSFNNIINILVDDKKKNKYINEYFNVLIKKRAKSAKKTRKISNKKYIDLNNIIKNLNHINYSQDWYNVNDNNYKYITSNNNGEIANINYWYLKRIDKKIGKIYETKRLDYSAERKSNICVLLKKVGDRVNGDYPIIYIDKAFSDLDLENIYKVKENDNKEEEIIRNQLIDSFQEFSQNIINNDIYYIKTSITSMKELHKNICLFVPSLKMDYYNFYEELYKNHKIKQNDTGENLLKLTLILIYQSIDLGEIEGFKCFLNIYYWLKIQSSESDALSQTKKSLKILRKSLEKIAPPNVEAYIIYLLSIKQNLYKLLLEREMYDEIIDKNDDYLKMFQINSILKNIKEMRTSPERYDDIDIEQEIKSLKKEYNQNIKEITFNSSITLSICEWADYKINKREIDKDKGYKFIYDSLHHYAYYNISDVIELYFIINDMKNELVNEPFFWELSEPENTGKVISPKYNSNKKIILLFFLSKISNFEKLKSLNYINIDNMNTFILMKEMVVSFDETEILKYNFSPITPKEEITKFLDAIIDNCKEQKKEILAKFKITNDMDKEFKKECLELEKNQEENSIMMFYQMNNKIMYLKDSIQKFHPKIYYLEKEELISHVPEYIQAYSKQFISLLKEGQENAIIRQLIAKSNKTTKSLSQIISKFTKYDELIILVPYNNGEICSYYNNRDKYYFPFYENNKLIKIPVYIVNSLFDNLLVGNVSSFGTLDYYKLREKDSLNTLANDYLFANMKELFPNDREMSKYILKHPKYMSDKENREEYIKSSCSISVYQHLELSFSEEALIYRKKI